MAARLNNFLICHYFEQENKMAAPLGAHSDSSNQVAGVNRNYCSPNKDLAVEGNYWGAVEVVGYLNKGLVISFAARNMMDVVDTF